MHAMCWCVRRVCMCASGRRRRVRLVGVCLGVREVGRRCRRSCQPSLELWGAWGLTPKCVRHVAGVWGVSVWLWLCTWCVMSQCVRHAWFQGFVAPWQVAGAKAVVTVWWLCGVCVCVCFVCACCLVRWLCVYGVASHPARLWRRHQVRPVPAGLPGCIMYYTGLVPGLANRPVGAVGVPVGQPPAQWKVVRMHRRGHVSEAAYAWAWLRRVRYGVGSCDGCGCNIV